MATSTLGFALLGLLARQKMTGYELAKSLKTSVGNFWTAGHSQIYPQLAKLEDDGLLVHEVVDGPGPRDTKRYAITDAGRRELGDWVAVPPRKDEPARSEILLKVFSVWLADPAQAVVMLRSQRERHDRVLRRYTDSRRRMEREEADAIDDPATCEFASYATLRAGTSYETHVIGWLDWMIDRLHRGK